MGWSSVFESSNILGLHYIKMGQPKVFNADSKTLELRWRWLKEANRQCADPSDAVLNNGNAAAEGQQLFQMSMAHFKHLSDSGHLCRPKVNEIQMQQLELPSKWYFNAKLNHHKVVSRCCEIWGSWLGRRELTDSQVSGLVFPLLVENT